MTVSGSLRGSAPMVPSRAVRRRRRALGRRASVECVARRGRVGTARWARRARGRSRRQPQRRPDWRSGSDGTRDGRRFESRRGRRAGLVRVRVWRRHARASRLLRDGVVRLCRRRRGRVENRRRVANDVSAIRIPTRRGSSNRRGDVRVRARAVRAGRRRGVRDGDVPPDGPRDARRVAVDGARGGRRRGDRRRVRVPGRRRATGVVSDPSDPSSRGTSPRRA